MEGSIFFIVIILSILIYFFLVYVVAKYGENRKLGFTWTAVIAVIFSPIAAFLLALISGRR